MKKPRIRISTDGVANVDSNELLKSDEGQRQLQALGRMLREGRIPTLQVTFTTPSEEEMLRQLDNKDEAHRKIVMAAKETGTKTYRMPDKKNRIPPKGTPAYRKYWADRETLYGEGSFKELVKRVEQAKNDAYERAGQNSNRQVAHFYNALESLKQAELLFKMGWEEDYH